MLIDAPTRMNTAQQSRLIAIFPGQGNQHPGMGRDLFDTNQRAQEMYKRADKITGKDITGVSFDGSREEQRNPDYLQRITYVHECALHTLAANRGIQADAYVGHSIGEYAALQAAGAMTFEQGLELVSARSELMKELSFDQSPLWVLLGASQEEVEQFCEDTDGEVQIALYNCPGNYVIGARPEALEKRRLQMPGKPRALPVTGPFHTDHYQEIASRFRAVLQRTRFQRPEKPVYANYDTRTYTTMKSIRDGLAFQLYQPVLWQQLMEQLIREGPQDQVFVEVGPGTSLRGMIAKIDPQAQVETLQDAQTLEAFVSSVKSAETSS